MRELCGPVEGPGGVYLLTSDSVARAVFALASALAHRSRTEGAELPVIDDSGCVAFVFMTIGYAVPLLVCDAPEDELEPEFQECVDDLQRRMLELEFQS